MESVFPPTQRHVCKIRCVHSATAVTAVWSARPPGRAVVEASKISWLHNATTGLTRPAVPRCFSWRKRWDSVRCTAVRSVHQQFFHILCSSRNTKHRFQSTPPLNALQSLLFQSPQKPKTPGATPMLGMVWANHRSLSNQEDSSQYCCTGQRPS